MTKRAVLTMSKASMLICALVVLCAGCGNKGPLVMPTKPAAEAVVDAQAQPAEAPPADEVVPEQKKDDPGIRD